MALAVVLKVGKQLEKHSDIQVIYTRKTDVFVELIERARIANRANANMFLSIHCNAALKGKLMERRLL
nr:N-acetylmuramoyl-L-alanine amidase [Flavobacterium piscinae]